MKIKFQYFIVFTVILFFGIGSCKNISESKSFTSFSGSFIEKGIPVPELADYRIVYYEPVTNISDNGITGTGIGSRGIEESDAPLTITGYGPVEVLPAVIKNPSIYAVFSQPVVPLAKLGDPIRENAGYFSIEPALTGIYRWYGTKLLSFEPDTDYLPQHRYTITVSDNIKSLGGKSLQGEKTFSFETERLSILEWSLGNEGRWVYDRNVHPEDAKYVRIIFSYPVNLNEIAKWIEVTANGRTWPFTLSRLTDIDNKRFKTEQSALLTITETLPLDTEVFMELKAGARSESDWLGAKESKTWNYHTLLPFRFYNIYARSYSSPRTQEGDSIPISLEFSQAVDPDNAEKYFSVEGFPALKKENVHVYGQTVVINNLPLEYQKNYIVTISASLEDLHGRALGKTERAEARIGEANSYVYIQNQGFRMMEAGFPPKIVWEAQNPVSLQSLITSVESPYDRIPEERLRNIDVSSLPVNSKQYFMEDLSPYLNAAGKGSAALRWDYRVKSYWDKDRIDSDSAWLTVQVTDIGITVRYAYNMVLVLASHISNGMPITNANVELLEGEKTVTTGKTDSRGLAVFNFSGGDFISRFTRPDSYNISKNKGFRIRVIEGQGNTKDQAEFVPNDSHNLWRFDISAASTPFTAEQEQPVIFLFTDRGLYRPGETVTFRGIDRNLKRGIYEAYQGQYKIEASTGAYKAPVIASLNGISTVSGGSFGSFTLPEKTEPGQYQLIYRRTGTTSNDVRTSISFTVANFERLRFESSVSFADITHYQGDKLNASLSASWLSGGNLSGAPYTWFMTREPAFYCPGGENDVWRNWRFGPEFYDGRSYIGQGEGNLGPDGKAAISGSTTSDGIEGAAYNYRIEASVQDAARQETASRSSALVHPASYYIAARIDHGTLKNAANAGGSESGLFAAPNPCPYFLNAGKPAALSWALVSPEAEPWYPAGAEELSIKLIRHEWKQAKQAGIGGRINLIWERVEETVEEHRVKIEAPSRRSSTASFISGVINFTPEKSGLWEVRIKGQDQEKRIAVTNFRFYVSGAGWVRWDYDDTDTINLTTDKNSYSPGEAAKILVRSPLEKGKYLLTLEREGIISQKIIELDGSALTIDIPIEESYIPIVYAAISSYTVRSGSPQNTYYEPDLDKPRGIFGVTPIHVTADSRNYKIEIENSKPVYQPAEKAEIKLKVTLNGKPAQNTEVSFMAVDRGVVDLINYHVPDPVKFFYDPVYFPIGVRGADSRSLLIDPVTYSLSDLQGGDYGQDDGKDMDQQRSNAAGSDSLNERKDFRPTAVFEPYLLTGTDGTVTVKFDLPDSLTTYRCTAVAAGLQDFGINEKDLKVSAPLTAVAALPRKLRWRDTGTVSLILTNLENSPVEATVSLTAAAAAATASIAANTNSLQDTIIEVDGNASKTVKIFPNTSAEVQFKVAALGVGEAQLVFTLSSPLVNERIIRTILVDRPALTETVTTIGNLSNENSFTEEGMILPSLVPEGTGNISVSLSASRLAMLKEAVRYLLDYPYGCIEQRTARLLPIIAFGEYLDTFDLDSRLKENVIKKNGSWNVQKFAEEELADLVKSQLNDGSFPYWPGGSRSDIFVSLRMAHIAALAKAKGWKVPAELNTRQLLSYITAISSNTKHFASYDPYIKGYSLWVRAMHGERPGAEIRAFLERGDELGIAGWALAGIAAIESNRNDLAVSARDKIRRFIRPGTRSLDLSDSYERQSYWGGDTDRYALTFILYQLLDSQNSGSADDMTSRLASSLIERQRRGVWGSTVSSFWAIIAFGIAADSESAQWRTANSTPLSANVSLGGVSLFNTEFNSYGSAPVSYKGHFSEQPLMDLSRDTLLPLRIERSGSPALYYTASLRYGIPAELASARDEGLCVFAETFDSQGHLVTGGKLTAGKTYTRKIVISSSRDRTHVALRAPIPSGAEIIDSTFITSSTTAPAPEDTAENAAEENYWDWHNFREPPLCFIMDDEARYHWDFFKAGKQEVEFRFRAVMPGIYPTPPPSAECMYEEEIFGRSAGELIRIE